MSSVLLTGPNGFVGAQIARRLVAQGHRVIALVRADDEESARTRLRRAWYDWPELEKEIGGRVEVIAGDITKAHFGLGETVYSRIASRIDTIIHTAASVRFDASLEEHMLTNLEGSRNILELARAVEEDHGLARLTHLSTAYVAGLYQGRVAEDHLSDSDGFASDYERSKFEAERLMRNAGEDLPITILRPSMIVGDSRTGEIRSFNTLYFPLRLYLTRRMRLLPLRGSTRLDMIPVDYVADSAVHLTFDPDAEGLTFHITCPRELRPTIRDLLYEVRGWAKEHLDISLPRGLCIPVPRTLISLYLRSMGRASGTSSTNLETLGNYFEERHDFLRRNTDRVLGGYTIDWREYLPNLLKYAVHRGFMHRSDRTVHEQILFRLRSRGRPTRLFDISGGRIEKIDNEAFESELSSIMNWMRSRGLARGARVGMVGTNSSRYMAIDAAIGLLGAVSVPMYFTSPPGDISDILRDSGASMLFVGCRNLLERIEEIDVDIPIVSFCDGEAPNGVTPWKEILEENQAAPIENMAPVDFGDVATIRYTSSTTGRPKGVLFTHGHLRWMAETMASLPSWETRNSGVNYLSFLPMNHVVEGILGAYSPYMAPSPLKIYFLDDLKALPDALPLVRPTIFFSVPRFYENLWRRFEESGWGRRYLTSGRMGKRILRGMIRRSMLRRSGLDKCSQLIVGSAPISAELLQRYRELGIEVHNAYGLTEAPLLTLNRMRENRIGTVGRPLPETTISISDEGEILARGPQVMMGYHGEPPLEDGVLRTGDLGHVDEDGYLTILGRRKEVIITSYGKNIMPLRIEQLLRTINGVAEVMVIGDAKPYLTALLWVDPGINDPDRLDSEVRMVNRKLSRPEKVRRWAVLPMNLTIEGGHQTANLKLRRKRVEEDYEEIISDLYRRATPATVIPKQIMHIGEVSRDELETEACVHTGE